MRKRAKRAIIASQKTRRNARLAQIAFGFRSGQAFAAQRTLAQDDNKELRGVRS
jgi:hypothetical protein